MLLDEVLENDPVVIIGHYITVPKNEIDLIHIKKKSGYGR